MVIGVSTSLSRFFVRFGLLLVRSLLAAKAGLIRSARLLAVIVRPIAKLVLSVVFVPIYRLTFGTRRQLAHWYRPAKNKAMFLLTNRAMMHVAMVVVVVGTAAINVGMDTVRAESLDAFNKSLAYALITQEQSPLVEEYADLDTNSIRGDATNYLSHASLSPVLGSIDGDDSMITSTASLAGGGGLAVPIIASSSASVAPRDGVETYTVAEGDALSTIAAKFGISINTILWANNLSVRSTIRPGQDLTILPVSGVMYTVKSGDSLIKLAQTYSAESSLILSANKLADASAITVGQKLLIPGGTPPTPAANRPIAVRNIFSPAPTGGSTSGSTSSSTRMVWPATGHYIVRGLSWFHTGVDIDCDGRANGTSTQDNIAAGDGIVQYSGWKSGYGYVVEINHGNSLMTRYGHNYSLYVKAGQQVTAGTPIARCGSTGNSTGTHLHFEVIGPRGSRDYRNPLEYIR